MTFAIAFLIGSGVVAAWINVCYPKLCPAEIPKLVLHLAAATLFLRIVVPLASSHTPYMGSPQATTLMSLFLITFPFLTYFLLGMTWVVRMCTNLLDSRFR